MLRTNARRLFPQPCAGIVAAVRLSLHQQTSIYGCWKHTMKLRILTVYLPACMFWNFAAGDVSANETESLIAQIQTVGSDGKGSQVARAARDRLAERGVKILPQLLAAMDTKNPVAANWYRTAFEEIVRRELAKPKPQLPLQILTRYARNPKRQGKVRRLALDVVGRLDSSFEARLIPTLLDDPEFRTDAVAAIIKQGDEAKKQGETEQAKTLYRTAFRHARESSQVTQTADRLKSVGETVKIIEHMGLIVDWHLLGPFNAPGKTGFTLSFPPEKNVDLGAVYTGKSKTQIRWKRHRTDDRLGLVNLARAIAPVKEAVGYAYTELNSPRRQIVELRCGADDNLTAWLNGKQVFSRLQWLNGLRLDRFTTVVTLKKGTNRLLVKVCQGPKHKNPAVPNNWSMQLRFCDAEGAGVGVTSALPPIDSH